MTTQVTGRMFSPSIDTIVSVSFHGDFEAQKRVVELSALVESVRLDAWNDSSNAHDWYYSNVGRAQTRGTPAREN